MVAERDRRPGEIRRRLREAERRLQVPDAPVGRVHLGHPGRELALRQLFEQAPGFMAFLRAGAGSSLTYKTALLELSDIVTPLNSRKISL